MSSKAEPAAWPGAVARVFEQAVRDTTVLAAVTEDAEKISKCPNFWMPRERIERGGRCALAAAEQLVCELYDSAAHSLLSEDWVGAEWWVQLYEPGRGLAFHFDKDEHLMEQKRLMSNPQWSSVVYLTGQARDAVPQGPTVVVNQLYDNEADCAVPEDPDRSILVLPAAGRALLFDGRLGHGVLSSCNTASRATMLVNWWCSQPQAVAELSFDDVLQHALSRMALSDNTPAPPTSGTEPHREPPPDTQHPTREAAAHEDGNLASASNASPSVTTASCPRPSDPILVDATTRPTGSGATAGSTFEAEEKPILTLLLPNEAEKLADPVMLDDLLVQKGVNLNESSDVVALYLHHPGLCLYPLDVPEGNDANGAEEGSSFGLAAALVPLSMMAGEDGSEDGYKDAVVASE